jgi:hypothetical protein
MKDEAACTSTLSTIAIHAPPVVIQACEWFSIDYLRGNSIALDTRIIVVACLSTIEIKPYSWLVVSEVTKCFTVSFWILYSSLMKSDFIWQKTRNKTLIFITLVMIVKRYRYVLYSCILKWIDCVDVIATVNANLNVVYVSSSDMHREGVSIGFVNSYTLTTDCI